MSGPGNEYVIEDHPFGHGRYGEVFRGRDGAGKPCAVLILHAQFHADPSMVHRFTQDRALLLGLTDPHLVRVRDLVVDDGQAFGIVTDLVEGPNLRDALAGVAALPSTEAARLGAEVSRALAAVHSAGFAHGDVKPANVLLEASPLPPVARLAEFGFARLFGDSEFARTATPTRTAYLAPELSLAAPPTPAGDLYALGVLLYELVAGETPFAGDTAVVARRSGLQSHRPTGVPDMLWDLICRLLAEDPAERPQSALGVALILDRCAVSPAPAPVRVSLPMPVPVPMPLPGPRREVDDVSALTVVPTPERPDGPPPARALPAGMVAGALAGALSAMVVLAAGGTVWSLTKGDGGGALGSTTRTSDNPVPDRATVSNAGPAATPSVPPVVGTPSAAAAPVVGPVIAHVPTPNPLNAAAAAFAAALTGAFGEDPITFSSQTGDAWELRRINVDRIRQTPPDVKPAKKTGREGKSRPKVDRVERYVADMDDYK